MNARCVIAAFASAAVAIAIGQAVTAHGAEIKLLSSNGISTVLEERVSGRL